MVADVRGAAPGTTLHVVAVRVRVYACANVCVCVSRQAGSRQAGWKKNFPPPTRNSSGSCKHGSGICISERRGALCCSRIVFAEQFPDSRFLAIYSAFVRGTFYFSSFQFICLTSEAVCLLFFYYSTPPTTTTATAAEAWGYTDNKVSFPST